MHQCGYYKSREYYKIQEIVLNTFYMKNVPCFVRTKDSVVYMETIYNGTFIKLVDLQSNNLNADMVYPISYLMGLPSITTNPKEINYNHDIICNIFHFLQFLEKNKIKFEYDTLVVLCNIPNLENAYWNGFYLSFGNGNITTTAFTSAMIVGHELSHALIQKINDLDYQGESGSLNESFADVIGYCFEQYMLEQFHSLGHELGSETGLTLRNMRNPHLKKQPCKVGDEYYVSPSCYYDNGGVHINSGISNHIFYCIEQLIGYKKGFELFIRILYKLNRYASFTDFRQVLLLVNSNMNYIDRKKLTDILDEHGL